MKRLIYRGSLCFPDGYHTGAGQSLEVSDHPLRLDVRGHAEVAGTSLAGALRADLGKLAGGLGPCSGKPSCRCRVCDLFGCRPRQERSQESAPVLRPSRLYVRTGHTSKAARPRIRDHVGIDRRTRTAAAGRKFDLELLEQVDAMSFELRIDQATTGDRVLLEQVLYRLAGGWLFLGGKSATGLGRARLERLDRHELDLGDAEALVAHLLEADPAAGASATQLVVGGEWGAPKPSFGEVTEITPAKVDSEAEKVPSWAQIRLGLELEFPFGLLVHDPAEALLSAHHHAFLRDGEGRPVLPGSSLRGALRSRAERILRSFGGERAACHLHDKAENCLGRLEAELADEEVRARLCLACQVFGCGHLASAVKVGELRPRDAGQELGEPRTQEHLAIDRFTGGGAKGLKFDAEHSPEVTLAGELQLEISPFRLEDWGLGLLALVLRDLLESDISLGFGSGRGNNTYRARLTHTDRFWLTCPAALAPLVAEDRRAAGPDRWKPSPALGATDLGGLVTGEARLAVESWVDALHQAIDRLEPWDTRAPTAEPAVPASGERKGLTTELAEARTRQPTTSTSSPGGVEPRRPRHSSVKLPRFPVLPSSRELAAVPLEHLEEALEALAGDGEAWGFRTLPDHAVLKRQSFEQWRQELAVPKLLEARIFGPGLDLHWLGDRGLLLVDPSLVASGRQTLGGAGWLERSRRSRLWGEWLESTETWYEARIPDPLRYEGLTPGPEHCVPFLRTRELIRGGVVEAVCYLGIEAEARKESGS